MLSIFFKTTLRNLWKNRVYSILNILGLTISIVCISLIYLWVENELTFDHNFINRDHLYQITENQNYDGKIVTFDLVPSPMANALKSEVSGVNNVFRISWNYNQLFTIGEKAIEEEGVYADSAIFSMLDLKFVQGHAATAFRDPMSVVITQSMAEKYFGKDNALGKTFKVGNIDMYGVDGLFVVGGVINDLPKNSSFQFQWLSPFELYLKKNKSWMDTWNSNLVHTIVDVQPANVANIDKELHGFVTAKTSENHVNCFLFSMNKWHLYNKFLNGKQDGGKIENVRIFSLIAWVILIIACINFMNLATARSEQRAKEIGIQKAIGADRKFLILQFIAEALLMSFSAVFLAIGILYLIIPVFNLLVGENLSVNIFTFNHILFVIVIGLVTGFFSGSYPAFYLTSFKPIKVLRGVKMKTNPVASFIRKGLVIVQFSVSVVLIISAVIIYQQLKHAMDRDMGYDKDNLIYLNSTSRLTEHFDVVRQNLISTGVVESAALSQQGILAYNTGNDAFSWQGKDPSKSIVTYDNLVSPEYISTMHLKLLSGRDFHADVISDTNNVIINKSLASVMGEEGRVGGIVMYGTSIFHIVGIVNDFLYNNMYDPVHPAILLCYPAQAQIMIIRLKPNFDLANDLDKVKNVIKKANQPFPFEYKFLDDEFDKQFQSEILIKKLTGVFASIAIFISCLGLFGLVSYMAERRTREIGIRKVLGASASKVIRLLSREFMLLVSISCIIAFPIAWWLMNNWLQEYHYRINIQVWVFAVAGGMAFIISFITISFQAIKAAMMNPIKSLRSE